MAPKTSIFENERKASGFNLKIFANVKTIDFLISNDILISEDNRVFRQYLLDKYSIIVTTPSTDITKIIVEKLNTELPSLSLE